MRLIDAIVGEREDGLVCEVLVTGDFVFLRDGEAELAVCVELVAQAVACMSGLADVRRGRPSRPGLLVGCRDARFQGEKLRAGDRLLVEVRSQWVRAPVASFTGSVRRGAETIAEVEVTVVEAEGDLMSAVRKLRD